MIEHARARQHSPDRIEWRQADVLALPFPDASFDVVCCQFGVMFLPDRVTGYREARRVLRPGGRFVFNTWDRIEENAFARDVTDALSTLFPDDPPRFMARTPHGYHDTSLVRRDLEKAGFDDVTIETVARTSRAASARVPALAFCHGTPLRGEIEARAAHGGAHGLDAATDRAEALVAERHGPGEVVGPMRAHVAVARAPPA